MRFQTPVDFDRPISSGPANDLAGDDRPIRIGPAAGHAGATAILGVLRQLFTVGEHDVTLEKAKELLLLRRSENPPKTAEHKAAETRDVEILAEQLAKSRYFLIRGGGSGHCLQLAAEVVDESGRIHACLGRN